MQPRDIRPGLVLRVINSNGLGAPIGSLASVKAIGTSPSGDWVCIIEYDQRRPPKHGTRLYRSHLWETDLGRFEIVTNQASSNHRKGKTHGAVKLTLQLRLPFDGEEVI